MYTQVWFKKVITPHLVLADISVSDLNETVIGAPLKKKFNFGSDI